MQQGRISFILPIYNGAPWINRCLSSIQRQSYPHFEVILVDDGSTDNSAELCAAFVQTDCRFSIYSIAHSGLSAARNYGLLQAQGSYIGFLDIDDWIEPEFSELLLKNANTHHAEIVSCQSIPTEKFTGYRSRIGAECSSPLLFTPAEYLALEYRDPGVNVRVCNKLYARFLFENVRFPCGKLYEDVATNYQLCRQCKTIVHLPLPLHNYFTGNLSITRSPLREQDLDLPAQWASVRQMARHDYPQLLPLIEAMEVMALRSLAEKYCRFGGEELIAAQLVAGFRSHFPHVVCSAEIPPEKKLRSLAAMINLKMYQRVTSLIRKGS